MGSMREAEKFSFGLLFMVLDVISQGLSAPVAIAKAIAEANNSLEVNPTILKQKINYAENKGYLKRFGDDSHPHYQLNRAGEQRLAQLRFSSLQFDPRRWDGHWRVLIFDIPENRRFVRDMIRRLIKQLGMTRLQRSVWLTPANCRAQFDELRQVYNLERQLVLLEIKHSSDLEDYKQYWNL